MSKATFAFVSLGCPKNLVDSERMLGKLAQHGYLLVPQANGADVVVINTCGFIEPAREESLGVIREMVELKKAGRLGAVVVAGCLAERQKEALLQQVPDIDHIVGVFGREEIIEVVETARKSAFGYRPAPIGLHPPASRQNPCDSRLATADSRQPMADSRLPIADEQRALFRPAPVRALEDTARLRITPRHYAYLKISEGCDRLCTFCAIPSMRGRHVSKPIEEVLREARELAGDGVRELILVAQDTTYYGLDLYGRTRLAELLRQLEKVAGLEWIRLLYTYPIFFTADLIDTLARSPKILPYLDLPLQHINDRLLRRMQRRVTRQETESLLQRLRQAIPRLVLRTTFIVGFPGETEAEFQELLGFAQGTRFERCGVFPFSLEPGTPASRLEGQIPEEIKQERRRRLMEAQQEIALAWSRQQVGQELEVIIDGADPELPNHWQARSYADAPDVDCLLRLKAKNLRPGDLVRAKVTAADGYDLVARAVGTVR